MFYKVYSVYSDNQYIGYSLFNQIWFIAIIYLRWYYKEVEET